MELEQRLKIVETAVLELQDQLSTLKQLYFNNVVTIDQAQNLFQQFDHRISQLEKMMRHIYNMIQ